MGAVVWPPCVSVNVPPVPVQTAVWTASTAGTYDSRNPNPLVRSLAQAGVARLHVCGPPGTAAYLGTLRPFARTGAMAVQATELDGSACVLWRARSGPEDQHFPHANLQIPNHGASEVARSRRTVDSDGGYCRRECAVTNTPKRTPCLLQLQVKRKTSSTPVPTIDFRHSAIGCINGLLKIFRMQCSCTIRDRY